MIELAVQHTRIDAADVEDMPPLALPQDPLLPIPDQGGANQSMLEIEGAGQVGRYFGRRLRAKEIARGIEMSTKKPAERINWSSNLGVGPVKS